MSQSTLTDEKRITPPGAPARTVLDELRELSAKATQGEWRAQKRYIGTANHMSCVGEVRDQNGNWSDTAKSTDDAAFIAAAANYVREIPLALPAAPALHDDERDLTDEDRIAYWKGAYDRMAARNIELDTRLATLCEPSNPFLAQVLDAFNGAQEDVKNHLFYNNINLFDALTRAKYATTKHNEEATRAFADIASERRRQTEAEGWTPHHDDEHDAGVLAAAGAAYALNAADQLDPHSQGAEDNHKPNFWPFEAAWWKPGDPRRDLVKAGALIAAEIERLDRAAASQPQTGEAL